MLARRRPESGPYGYIALVDFEDSFADSCDTTVVTAVGSSQPRRKWMAACDRRWGGVCDPVPVLDLYLHLYLSRCLLGVLVSAFRRLCVPVPVSGVAWLCNLGYEVFGVQCAEVARFRPF